MQVTAESFWNSAGELEEQVSNSKGQEWVFGAVPASSCAMGFISDPPYVEGNRAVTESRRIRAREANVQLWLQRQCQEGVLVSKSFYRWSLIETSGLRKISS